MKYNIRLLDNFTQPNDLILNYKYGNLQLSTVFSECVHNSKSIPSNLVQPLNSSENKHQCVTKLKTYLLIFHNSLVISVLLNKNTSLLSPTTKILTYKQVIHHNNCCHPLTNLRIKVGSQTYTIIFFNFLHNKTFNVLLERHKTVRSPIKAICTSVLKKQAMRMHQMFFSRYDLLNYCHIPCYNIISFHDCQK